MAGAPFHIWSDSLNTVNQANSSGSAQLHPHKKYTGIRKTALTAAAHNFFQGTAHILAHRTQEQKEQMSPAELALTLANETAFNEAKV